MIAAKSQFIFHLRASGRIIFLTIYKNPAIIGLNKGDEMKENKLYTDGEFVYCESCKKPGDKRVGQVALQKQVDNSFVDNIDWYCHCCGKLITTTRKGSK
jgi:hypothetical protein